MKKTYIKPQNTVVCINVESMIAQSIKGTNVGLYRGGDTEGIVSEGNARETVSAPDAWEEW